MCLKLMPPITTPLNAGELKVYEGTHETKPMGLLEWRWGQKNKQKNASSGDGILPSNQEEFQQFVTTLNFVLIYLDRK